MNTRRFHRKKVSSTSVEITDGNNMLEGMVRNVSNTGIEVSLKAELADPRAAKYRLHLSHNDQAYSIAAIPRWQKMNGGRINYSTLGVRRGSEMIPEPGETRTTFNRNGRNGCQSMWSSKDDSE